MRAVYTIGYEGADIEDFVATLKDVGIDLVVDIRELPLSRKRGFSKRALESHLNESGLQYLHIQALGDPKQGRIAARNGDYALFKRIFGKHLRSAIAQEALEAVASIARKKTICLLCFEKAFTTCHRGIVAQALSKNFGAKIKHVEIFPALVPSRGRVDGKTLREFAIR